MNSSHKLLKPRKMSSIWLQCNSFGFHHRQSKGNLHICSSRVLKVKYLIKKFLAAENIYDIILFLFPFFCFFLLWRSSLSFAVLYLLLLNLKASPWIILYFLILWFITKFINLWILLCFSFFLFAGMFLNYRPQTSLVVGNQNCLCVKNSNFLSMAKEKQKLFCFANMCFFCLFY